MNKFVPWNSQPLGEWAQKFATGEFIDLDGHSTHYIVTGAGEPIILIHGFFYDTFTWHNNIDALAQHFKVYAIDLWGFGYSTRKPLDYGYPLFAEQLLSFMDAINIPKVSLVGHSMGGGTSIYFATRHRDRVNKLVLVDAAGMANPTPLLGKIMTLPPVGKLIYGLNNNFIRTTALKTGWIQDDSYVTDSYFENVTRFHKIKGTNEVLLTVLRKHFFDSLQADVHRLGQMEIPILLVWGRHDKAVPLVLGREMHDLLKGSRLEVFDNMSHGPHDEAAERFNQLAIDFLR